jgi:hypothetical protein
MNLRLDFVRCNLTQFCFVLKISTTFSWNVSHIWKKTIAKTWHGKLKVNFASHNIREKTLQFTNKLRKAFQSFFLILSIAKTKNEVAFVVRWKNISDISNYVWHVSSVVLQTALRNYFQSFSTETKFVDFLFSFFFHLLPC